jgi:hypothetical protein
VTGFLILLVAALTALLGLGGYYEWFLLPSERAGYRPPLTFTSGSRTLHEETTQTGLSG